MHRRFAPTLRTFLLGSLALCGAAGLRADRASLDFNPDWRFTKTDPVGVPAAVFDDSGWARVAAPHTFNDADTFDNFSPPNHRGETDQWSGRTWYRKTFRTSDAWRGKKVFLEFEAARQVAEVYLNGRLLGTAKSGFTPFGFDLTEALRSTGDVNVLAVMVDNRFMKDLLELPAETTRPRPANLKSMLDELEARIPATVEELRADDIPWNNPHWHPAHGGLYRNVRLHVADPLHFALPLYSFLRTEGPYAYATRLSPDSADIGVELPVRNHRPADATAEARVEILNAAGQTVLVLTQPVTLAAGAETKLTLKGAIAAPLFWEPAHPHVYRVRCELRAVAAADAKAKRRAPANARPAADRTPPAAEYAPGDVIDSTEIPLGLRTVRWDAAAGFFINGRHLKLRGWGQKPTDEWPGLGAAQPDWMHAYTLGLMRDAGANFVRWGHCAAGPAMIAAGDRLGLVAVQPGVDGEKEPPGGAWLLRAQAFRDTLIYFRNHPSILVWEGGNQKVSREKAAELRALMDRWDPHGGRAYAHRRADAVTAEFMDVGIGTEGGREIAALAVVEGEYNREESPRRVWDEFTPPNFGYPEAKGQTYQLTSEQFAVNQVAHFTRKLGAADHAGGANWIFSDTTSGGRVTVEVARTGGEVDAVRLPKEAYWVCAAMFRDDPQVHIVGHWNYPAGGKKTVYVATNLAEVELFVNGRSLGRQKPASQFLCAWPDVAWEAGEIKAVATAPDGRTVTQAKRTAGPPFALRLTPLLGPGGWRADGSDVALVDVEAVDADGNRCPTFQRRVDFTFVGAGTWRGGYNSGQERSTNRRGLELEAGVNRVAVRATHDAGEVVLRATCPGLQAGGVTLRAQPVAIRDGALPLARAGATQAWVSPVRPAWSFPPAAPLERATPAVEPTAKRVVAPAVTPAPPPASVTAPTTTAVQPAAPSPAPVIGAPRVSPIAPPSPATSAVETPASPAASATTAPVEAVRTGDAPSTAIPPIATPPVAPKPPAMLGRFTRALSYSGPASALVHVEARARDGKNAYVDVDSPFAALPIAVVGADWVQVAQQDATYHAVDLIELAVPAGTRVYVAHDDRLPRPAWLLAQFRETDSGVYVRGHKMTLFTKPIAADASLTFGPNTEATVAPAANQYVVFVQRPE